MYEIYTNQTTTPVVYKEQKLRFKDTYEEDEQEVRVTRASGEVEHYPKTVKVVVDVPPIELNSSREVKLDEPPDVEKMTKKQLEELAWDKYHVDLDRRKSHKSMVQQVKALMRG